MYKNIILKIIILKLLADEINKIFSVNYTKVKKICSSKIENRRLMTFF